ncbi:MAG: GTPase Era [Bacteroidia bacterium]|nr:GTPase Era [Bacteroidia bacterium]MDW8134442.1 GTPase Era [Bacteroidia bacterium]
MTRAGFVALIGAPNAGKSTLFNRLVGEKLAAVTPKPQTTRFTLQGILTCEKTQYVFVDTPGWIASPRNRWHHILTQQSLSAAKDADIQLWVYSHYTSPSEVPQEVVDFLRKAPCLCVGLTYLDILTPHEREKRLNTLLEDLNSYPIRWYGDISMDRPLEPLLESLASLLPASPFLYPSGQLTPLPVRFFVAEIIREKVYEHLHEEIPYGTEVEITLYRETPEKDYIVATLHVEKASQKPIAVGKKGQMIKKIGSAARQAIEAWLNKRVYLELHVKVSSKWRQSPLYLKSLGYRNL